MDLYRNRKLQVIHDETLCFPICNDHLSPPPPFWRLSSPPPPATQNSIDSSAFVILAITFISLGFFILACALYSKYKQNRSIGTTNPNPSPNSGPHIRMAGFDPAMIATIVVVKYKKYVVKSADCSVCLSEFEEGEPLRLLPKCSHAFHMACIDMWLLSHSNCPMCRAPVILPPEEDPRTPVVPEDESYGGEISHICPEETTAIEPCQRSVSHGCLDAKELEMINRLRDHNIGNNVGKKLLRMRSENVSSSSSLSVKRSNSCNGKFFMCSPIRVMD